MMNKSKNKTINLNENNYFDTFMLLDSNMKKLKKMKYKISYEFIPCEQNHVVLAVAKVSKDKKIIIVNSNMGLPVGANVIDCLTKDEELKTLPTKEQEVEVRYRYKRAIV